MLDEVFDIDQRIASLELEISLLRRRRNVLQPVSRLFPELLSDIFVRVQGVIHPPEMSIYASGAHLEWFCLLKVCHMWRGIAIGTPDLWTRLDLTMSSFKSAIWADWLTRSGALPMHIRMDVSENALSGLKMLPKTVLHLSLRNKYSSLGAIDTLTLSFLHTGSLRSLCIDGLTHGYERLRIEAPQNVSESRAGELRQLLLSACGPSASFLRGMHNLQSLRLNQCVLPQDFFSVVEGMPQLCLMQLAEFDFSSEPNWESALPTHLPELQVFYLFHDQASMFVRLMSLLDAPRLRIIDVNALYDDDDDEDPQLPVVVGKSFDSISKAGYVIQTLCVFPKGIRGGAIRKPAQLVPIQSRFIIFFCSTG
jgi:hypothetical protein